MTDLAALRDFGLILVVGTLFLLLARRISMPSIVAYILAGLVLGPVSGLVGETESVSLIAEAGIALLLFLVGLELSFDKIRDVGRVALVAGLGQVVFTAVGGLAFSLLLGFGFMEAVFISTALTFSSTVVVVKLLGQKHELDALYGRIAVGIFLVQDLVVIVVLTLIAGLGGGEEMAASAVAGRLGAAFGGMLVLLGAALGAARWVLPRLFGWIAPSNDGLFIWSLAWCFLFVLVAELFHLSPEIGAFLAGISLAQLPFNMELRRRVAPLMNFFVAVFFVSLGIGMELGQATEHWLAGLGLAAFVLLGNPFIFMVIIARMGYGERTSFLTSVTVAQISEFSFIFAAAGVTSGLIDTSILSLVAVIGVLTIGLSAYMILYNHELYAFARRTGMLRWLGARAEPEETLEGTPGEATGAGGHVIVVGMNALGRRIVRELAQRGEDVLAVDTSGDNLARLPARTMLGNAEHVTVLEEAGIRDAKLLVSTLQIEETNQMLAYWGRRFGVPTSIHAFEQSLVDDLTDAGATHLILSKAAGTRRIADAFRRAGVFE